MLRPLGFKLVRGTSDCRYFGLEGLDDFAICTSDCPTVRAHVAFLSPSQEAVREFYAAALANGGSKRLAPAFRIEYHAEYYAAFVNDPEDNNIEAVHYGPGHPLGAESMTSGTDDEFVS